MLPPLPLGHPTIAITPDKVEIYPKKEGVKGMPSLGCFPLWGREGAFTKLSQREMEYRKKEDFNRAKKLISLQMVEEKNSFLAGEF